MDERSGGCGKWFMIRQWSRDGETIRYSALWIECNSLSFCPSCVAKLEAENAKLVARDERWAERWEDLWEGFERIDGIPVDEIWTLDDLAILRKCKEKEFPLPDIEAELPLDEEGEG